ncbi:MAG: hypothetical protein LUH11_03540 [Candidatus Gastranaerophilales bacterium]|nr:hypothetical protein [Candidatus Gastranaerophilales bacterium]
MITKISNYSAAPKISQNNAPSFGFARMNDLGMATADSFGYKRNEFIDGSMFRKQGMFQQSILSRKVKNKENFVDLCRTYGCSQNPKANADFIKNQIVNNKSIKAVSKNVNQEDLKKGLGALYLANYDNPDLSLKMTKALLELAKESMEPEEFVKHSGLLEVGADKK